MENHKKDYGDNAECDTCGDIFDARNSHYEIINGKWVCAKCADKLWVEKLDE
jgi:formylmethanofuran dehydrogenase subunit E